MGGVFDAPMASVQGQDVLCIGGVGGVACDAVGGFDAGLSGCFAVPCAADHEDLADAREVEVLVEGGGGPNRPLLDASVRDGGWFLEVWLGFRLGGEEQGNIAPQGRLIVLNGQEVVGVAFEEVGRKLALGQQRIGGEGLAADVLDLVEKRNDGADFVGAFGLVVGAGLQADFFWV